MKKLWKFELDLCDGELFGLFLATAEEINSLVGKEVYFGEVLGKHSEVCEVIESEYIELFSDNEYVISHVEPFGYNPFDYFESNHNYTEVEE